MSTSMSTEVAADPASCRDTAAELRALRRRADRAEDHGRERSRHFASASAAGQAAEALSSACQVVSAAGRRLSDDADTAETALSRFADGIEDVEQGMEQAWSAALAAGLQSSLYRDIVLPADPTDEQVLAWNDAVATVNRLRERELALQQALVDALSAITPEQLPRPQGLAPAEPLPVPQGTGGSGGSGGSGGGADGGSGGGAGGGSGSAGGSGPVGGRDLEPTGGRDGGRDGGGGRDHAELVGVTHQAGVLQAPDVQGELRLSQQVRDHQVEVEGIREQLAATTDPVAQEALVAELAAAEQQLAETQAELEQLQQRNDEIEAAQQAAHAAEHGQRGDGPHGDGPRGHQVAQAVGQPWTTLEATGQPAGPAFEPLPDAHAWPLPGPR